MRKHNTEKKEEREEESDGEILRARIGLSPLSSSFSPPFLSVFSLSSYLSLMFINNRKEKFNNKFFVMRYS